MRPDCQLRAFNAEVTGSFTIALSPCSHSCPPTLVPSFKNDEEGYCGWCIALSFHGTSSPRTWRSSVISPNSFGPSLVILGRFPPRPGPLGLIVDMGWGTQILWPHNEFIDQMANNIQLTWKLSWLLRTYKICNSTVTFSKYEFYNKLLSDVTLLRITLDITWTQPIIYFVNRYNITPKRVKLYTTKHITKCWQCGLFGEAVFKL